MWEAEKTQFGHFQTTNPFQEKTQGSQKNAWIFNLNLNLSFVTTLQFQKKKGSGLYEVTSWLDIDILLILITKMIYNFDT